MFEEGLDRGAFDGSANFRGPGVTSKRREAPLPAFRVFPPFFQGGGRMVVGAFAIMAGPGAVQGDAREPGRTDGAQSVVSTNGKPLSPSIERFVATRISVPGTM